MGVFLALIILLFAVSIRCYFLVMNKISIKKERIFFRWRNFVAGEENLIFAIKPFLLLAVDYKGHEMRALVDDFAEFGELVYSLDKIDNDKFFEVKEKESSLVSSLSSLYYGLIESCPTNDLKIAYISFQQALIVSKTFQEGFSLSVDDFEKVLPSFLRPAIS